MTISDDGTRKKRTRAAWVLLFNLGVILAILGGVEFGARIVNERAGYAPKPFMVDVAAIKRAPFELRQEGKTTKMSYLDPHLGYAHEHAVDRELGKGQWLPGFVLYGDVAAEGALRIVALGGSTTDPLDKGNWPKQLQAILTEEGIPAVVYNGGVSGYSTNQELLKLMRDVLPLSPDIVISLSGVNDLAFVHSVPDHPMVHPYQKRLLEAVTEERSAMLLPNTRAWIRHWREAYTPDIDRVKGINYGPPVVVNHAQQWARNIGMMYALSQFSNIEFVGYLQPILGVGAYKQGPDDEKLIQDVTKSLGPNYLPLAKDFFATAGIWTQQTPYAVDLTGVFDGETNLYRDQRHPNAEGYRKIAQAIRDDLSARKLLSKSQSR